MGAADAGGRAIDVSLDELAISFLGRHDIAPLWQRVQAGEPIDDPRDNVRLMMAASRAHERAGRLAEACSSARQAIEHATTIDDSMGVAGGLSHLAYAHYRLGHHDEASTLAKRALAEATPHPHTITGLFVLGLVALDACRWDEARELFVRARSWSATVDYPLGLMLALHNLSVVYFHTGQFDLAVSAASDVGRLNQEIKYPGWAYPWTRAMVAQFTGDRESARAALAELEAVQPPAAFATSLARMLEAQLALDEDDIDAAEAALIDARLEAERLGNPMVRSMVLLVTSRVRRARGDPASAHGWVNEAIDEVRRGGLATLDGWMQLERSRVLWQLDDLDQAETIARDALRVADDRSAAHVAAEASVLLASLASTRAERSAPSPPTGGDDGDSDEVSDRLWVEAAQRVRAGGYGFLLERDRALVVPRVAALARRRQPAPRRAGLEMLGQLARVAPVPLRIVGLGRFEVSQGRRQIPAADWRKRRAGELFRFLLLQRHHRAPRDVAMEALWPGQPSDRVQALLHQASSTLRRVLEPELPDKFPSRYLHMTGESIELTLPAGSSVDFAVFDRRALAALRQADVDLDLLRSVVDSDAGDLFPDDRYADWTAAARQRLAERGAAVAEKLAGALLAAGDALAALDVSTQVIARDPLRERATMVAMEASLAVGDRVSAARLYRRFEKVLDDELGIRPSAELQRLAASLDQ